jgi:type II secretory pathway component GspD/PulD (secretin)
VGRFWGILKMKHYFSVFTRRHIALTIFLFLVMLCLILPVSSTEGNESNMGDELISLTVKDEPLGDVLYKVSMATGYDIIVDNKWQNYRVSASLEEVSLHKGLKRILRNLNSAIIYVSRKRIKIVIYDKTTPDKASLAPTAEGSFDKSAIPQHKATRPSDYRPTTPETIEAGDSSIFNEEPSDPLSIFDNEGTNKNIEDSSSGENDENDTQIDSKKRTKK